METQDEKNTQRDPKEEIKLLEAEAKSAFKGDNPENTMATIKKIQAIDPENRLAQKLIAKLERTKAKEESKAKAEKAKEYEGMLKSLSKDQDVEKLVALAKEFKDYDPGNKHADKWMVKAEKLKAKLSEEKKPGLLSRLFKKSEKTEEVEEKVEIVQKETENKPESVPTPVPTPTPTPAPTPLSPIAPIQPIAVKTEEKPKEAPVEAMQEVSEEKKTETKEEKGNLFTRMFKKKDEEIKKGSIIDNIVAKTDKKEEPKADKAEAIKPVEEKGGQSLLTFSKVFMNFAIVFIALSAAFLYVEWIDKDNRMLSIVGIQENTGLRLHSAAETVDGLKVEEEELNKEIELYKGGYNDQALATVQKIIEGRIDWPGIFTKINEVTNSVYELNDFFKYIEYNNYSFDATSRTIRVSGTLSDPLGRNLTKLVELEEAFKYYPKDRDSSEDTTEPYFIGFKEFTSFSKSLNAETGRYSSSFQLSFSLNK